MRARHGQEEPVARWSVELTPRAAQALPEVHALEYAYALRVEAVRRGELATRRLDEIAASLGLDD